MDAKALILSEIEAHGYCDITGETNWNHKIPDFRDWLKSTGLSMTCWINQDAARVQKEFTPQLSLKDFNEWGQRCLIFGLKHANCPTGDIPVRCFPAQVDETNLLTVQAVCFYCKTTKGHNSEYAINLKIQIGPKYPTELHHASR